MSSSEINVLGIDLGPSSWRTNGSAKLSFLPRGPGLWTDIRMGVLRWPAAHSITPAAMASAIDDHCTRNAIAAVSIDGPQGWRDPFAAADRPGVGRACEKSARTPGKTGPKSTTYPRDQVGWISFSISVFDDLLRRPHVCLANDPHDPPLDPPAAGTYFVLECFPTSTWRASGLIPLPSKARKPDLELFADALRRAFNLPAVENSLTHDDLQAVVAALSAASLFVGASPVAHGEPARLLSEGARDIRAEGIIWDATPGDRCGAPRYVAVQ
jgi:hypothetical protein